jgi:hypothetical protein
MPPLPLPFEAEPPLDFEDELELEPALVPDVEAVFDFEPKLADRFETTLAMVEREALADRMLLPEPDEVVAPVDPLKRAANRLVGALFVAGFAVPLEGEPAGFGVAGVRGSVGAANEAVSPGCTSWLV